MNEQEKIGYLKRSYSAVDGLWFMMVEEAFGFEKALELDKKVWEVMPKIQGRFIKEHQEVTDAITGLKTAFTEKLEMDGCEFDTEETPAGFDIRITRCPWHETMIRSGREDLSPTIGKTICTAEYGGWTKEFGDGISLNIEHRICCGEADCLLRFSK